jgi:uncharacterized protein (DUF488 family)
MTKKHYLATIGYEAATVPDFMDALNEAGIKLVVDIRAVAASRRPGFAKTRLAAGLKEEEIDYIHMRALGTPSEGRAAAKKGHHEEMRKIFLEKMETEEAQNALNDLRQLIESGRKLAILCFEANPEHCHRNIVAHLLEQQMPLTIDHLRPHIDD